MMGLIERVLEVFDAARHAQHIVCAGYRTQPVLLSLKQRLRMCSWDQCSAGSNATMKAMESGRFL